MKKLTLINFLALLFILTSVQAQDVKTTCNEQNLSNGFEKSFLSGSPLLPLQVPATDITISADTDMSLTSINANLWVRGIGETVASANIIIYGDASGLPDASNLIAILLDLVPVSQPSIGIAGAGLDFDVLDVTFDIPATMLAGQAGSTTTYWVVIYITASNGDDATWEATSATFVGNEGAISSNGGATWATITPNYDFVYNFSGDCSPLSVVENVINPVSATTTLSAQFGSSLDNAINGAGLDAFPSLSASHEATTPGNSFLATNEPGSIDFDLGGSYLVDGLSFWNENGPGPGGTGIQEVVVSSSEDGVTYTPIAGSPTTFSRVMAPTSPAESFSFTAVTASFIRFDVMSNYGDPGNLVAFAEVAFSGTAYEQQLSLQPGWSIISSYIQPSTPALETVFGENSNEVIFMLANSGIYWPSQNINTIGNWDVNTGYKIKMNDHAIINFQGQKSGNSISLPAGVSYLPVLSENAVDNELLFELGNTLLYAFDLQAATVFWPEGELYTLTTLEPGKGYLIALNNPATVVFPENSLKSVDEKQKPLFVNNTIWNDVNKTGEIHIISIDKNALANLQAGDVIGAFNSNGLNVGMAEYTKTSANISLVVYGDDNTTEAIDGLLENENITLKLYRLFDKTSTILEATFDYNFNKGTFASNGTSKIIDLKSEALGINPINESSISVYPNPARGVLNISNYGDQKIHNIEIFNSQGQNVYSSGFNTNASTAINVSGLSKGLYFINLSTDNTVVVKKIMIN